ncbi:isoprenylcysteine carboxylmethyltransferase family protein [Marivibrio halodurans]|uniref:Isoprenylcysteine carboxylmethyltransferase family protein n=1 Tax=Marivibrio halodurans TaxID=2039722 RepID=A0A8J7V2C3_9PROT|nr:isoprenylcysteine carboxylmethyltransferase family protein [Marivibrio halodurans]MBP5857021.1 isoprenylcysteine carboxylmethyltransferase family protein [Marivibrio halodurans]
MGDNLSSVQKTRKRVALVFALASIPILLVAQPFWLYGTVAHEAIEYLGVALLALCVLGRTWCTLYIGGRKKGEVVDVGPYSLCRNPLYVFSTLGLLGIGLTTGSLLIGLGMALACFVLFDVVARREEAVLMDRFGATYRSYQDRTPRWIPNLSSWRDEAERVFSPRLVLISFRDSSLFLLFYPLLEVVEYAHLHDLLPSLLLLF